jgi:hypothetical protein
MSGDSVVPGASVSGLAASRRSSSLSSRGSPLLQGRSATPVSVTDTAAEEAAAAASQAALRRYVLATRENDADVAAARAVAMAVVESGGSSDEIANTPTVGNDEAGDALGSTVRFKLGRGDGRSARGLSGSLRAAGNSGGGGGANGGSVGEGADGIDKEESAAAEEASTGASGLDRSCMLLFVHALGTRKRPLA